MVTNAHNAWVIHKKKQGETSLYISFFTETGMFSGLYKGGRHTKKQHLVQEFTPLWINVNRFNFIDKVELQGPTITLKSSALFSGLYLNELLYLVLKPNCPMPKIFSLYECTLNALKKANNRLAIERALRQFEWLLLIELGLQMSLTYDIHGKLIDRNCHYQLVPGAGFVRVSNGILGLHIILFKENNLEDEETLKIVKIFMRLAMDFALEGKTIKTRELFGVTNEKIKIRN